MEAVLKPSTVFLCAWLAFLVGVNVWTRTYWLAATIALFCIVCAIDGAVEALKK